MKSEHTPKPWTAINMNGRFFPSVQIGPLMPWEKGGPVTGEHKISVTTGQPPDEKLWSNTMETAQANARLIAAAPDYHEACKDIPLPEVGWTRQEYQLAVSDWFRANASKIMAANAKAEGVKP